MMTEIGYSTSSQNKEMVTSLDDFFDMKSNKLAWYWFFKCLSILLLPRPFVDERDKKSEIMNKSILLDSRTGVIKELVGSIMGRKQHSHHDIDQNGYSDRSEVVTMVAGNIIELIICSHHDTTPIQRSRDVFEEIREE